MRLLAAPLVVLLAACSSRGPSVKAPATPQGTWRLVDLAGSEALVDPPATLTFSEDGKIAGSGSCNRFFGTAKVASGSIEIAGLGSTKMACPEPIMGQEQRYFEALSGATRYEVEGSQLTIWVKGSERPLRFVRQEP